MADFSQFGDNFLRYLMPLLQYQRSGEQYKQDMARQLRRDEALDAERDLQRLISGQRYVQEGTQAMTAGGEYDPEVISRALEQGARAFYGTPAPLEEGEMGPPAPRNLEALPAALAEIPGRVPSEDVRFGGLEFAPCQSKAMTDAELAAVGLPPGGQAQAGIPTIEGYTDPPGIPPSGLAHPGQVGQPELTWAQMAANRVKGQEESYRKAARAEQAATWTPKQEIFVNPTTGEKTLGYQFLAEDGTMTWYPTALPGGLEPYLSGDQMQQFQLLIGGGMAGMGPEERTAAFTDFVNENVPVDEQPGYFERAGNWISGLFGGGEDAAPPPGAPPPAAPPASTPISPITMGGPGVDQGPAAQPSPVVPSPGPDSAAATGEPPPVDLSKLQDLPAGWTEGLEKLADTLPSPGVRPKAGVGSEPPPSEPGDLPWERDGQYVPPADRLPSPVGPEGERPPVGPGQLFGENLTPKGAAWAHRISNSPQLMVEWLKLMGGGGLRTLLPLLHEGGFIKMAPDSPGLKPYGESGDQRYFPHTGPDTELGRQFRRNIQDLWYDTSRPTPAEGGFQNILESATQGPGKGFDVGGGLPGRPFLEGQQPWVGPPSGREQQLFPPGAPSNVPMQTGWEGMTPPTPIPGPPGTGPGMRFGPQGEPVPIPPPTPPMQRPGSGPVTPPSPVVRRTPPPATLGGTAPAAAEPPAQVVARIKSTWGPTIAVSKNTAAAEEYAPIVAQEAVANDVPEDLIWAVMSVESEFDPTALGNLQDPLEDGWGLMQITKGVANDNGITDLEQLRLSPELNIRLGTELLAKLKAQFGSWEHAISAYNQGAGALPGAPGGNRGLQANLRAGGGFPQAVPGRDPGRTTQPDFWNQGYVDKVMTAWKKRPIRRPPTV